MNGNLSSYRIFHTVAQKGNISYAAKELYISQPAISKAISKLEENLNTTLFYRSSRGVTLTESGMLLYEHTKKAFAELEEGEEKIKKAAELGIGQIRIGASTTLCKYILLPYLKRFMEIYPHIKMTITCQSTFHTIKLLEEDKIDIGLVGSYGFGKDIRFLPLQSIEDIFVMSPSYKKVLQATDGRSQLEEGTLLLLDEQNISRHYIENYLKENAIEAKQLLEVGSMDLLIEFAKLGLGIACVIREFVSEELKKGELEIVPIPKIIEPRQVGFAYSRRGIMTETMKHFLEYVEV